MTVQELINELEKIEDKNQKVLFRYNDGDTTDWGEVIEVDDDFFYDEVVLKGVY